MSALYIIAIAFVIFWSGFLVGVACERHDARVAAERKALYALMRVRANTQEGT